MKNSRRLVRISEPKSAEQLGKAVLAVAEKLSWCIHRRQSVESERYSCDVMSPGVILGTDAVLFLHLTGIFHEHVFSRIEISVHSARIGGEFENEFAQKLPDSAELAVGRFIGMLKGELGM
jgi:hypothetical protein